MTIASTTRRGLVWVALAALSAPWSTPWAAVAPDALSAMVALDALYIPALSLTSAAQVDPKAAPRAAAAAQRLRTAWPGLQRRLQAHPPSAAQTAPWLRALKQVGRQLVQAEQSVGRADWKQAHEDLEPVRMALMQARRAAGFDYFVDRLTAFHEPMETLALAAAQWQPADLDAPRRQTLERAFAHAASAWREVERHLPDPRLHRLSAAREAQFQQGLAAEARALSHLSEALRDPDPRATLAAAKALKPPFARAFTAFGLADGEAPLNH